MRKIVNDTKQLKICVKDMESHNILRLTKCLRRHKFDLRLDTTNRRVTSMFVFNYKEDKVDSSGLFSWILANGGISSYCL